MKNLEKKDLLLSAGTVIIALSLVLLTTGCARSAFEPCHSKGPMFAPAEPTIIIIKDGNVEKPMHLHNNMYKQNINDKDFANKKPMHMNRKEKFNLLDSNKDGNISQDEWDSFKPHNEFKPEPDMKKKPENLNAK